MNKVIDFYFDYGSPATYLAWTQIYKIVEEADANLNMIPMLLEEFLKKLVMLLQQQFQQNLSGWEQI